jgi:hypothetical protein
MRYVWFSLGFFLVHLGAYVVAGVVSQTYSRRIYQGPDAVLAPLLRDVADEAERRRQGLVMVPAQLLRALLMSVVLYPLLGPLGELSAPVLFAFLAGLMFVYTDLAAAVPFPNTIEGVVYLHPGFVGTDVFLRIQSEAVIYSFLFAGLATWLLF